VNSSEGHTHGVRPTFLVIGAQKAGTVSLYSYLSSHPNIAPSSQKEIGYFDQEIAFRRGLEWYLSFFPQAREVTTPYKAFEATPDYLYYPKAVDRIHQFDPHMKLVVLLRDPATRAYSAWNMFRNLVSTRAEYLRSFIPECDPPAQASLTNMLESDPFPEFATVVEAEIRGIRENSALFEPGYVQRGLYHVQLSRYLQRFDRAQILVIDSHRLKVEPASVLFELTRFIDLPEFDWSRYDFENFHIGDYEASLDPATASLMREFYEPHNRRLYELLGIDFGW
jgi:hypothetical protein